MKKSIFTLTLLTLLSSFSFAATDSVAVFHRPDKVVVLVKEATPQGRIGQFMDALSAGNQISWTSPGESVRLNCGRSAVEAVCTFRFLPGPEVRIGNKELAAFTSGEGLQKTPYEMAFISSREDQFFLKMDERGLLFNARKKSQGTTSP